MYYEMCNENMYDIIYVGIDDTDSSRGMCTTYITAVVMDELKDYGFQIIGYPRLIRLNPFARFKTRGNGAVSFKLLVKSNEEFETAKNLILNGVEKLSHLEEENTNPGVVFYKQKMDVTNIDIDDLDDELFLPKVLEDYAQNTVRNLVTIEDAEKTADLIGAEIYKFKKGRGIIGALASIGCPLEDRTFELLAYRIPLNYGTKRRIKYESVLKMDQITYPCTFDNLDEEEGYIAIEPHTPCPILWGIRGETSDCVKKAHDMIKSCEPIERTAIFITNQHTDQHLLKINQISNMTKYNCYIVKGEVADNPHVIAGGHVILKLRDDSGSIECAAYEPTKGFRDIFKQLIKGDFIKVYGGIGEKGTLNVEKFKIIELAKAYNTINPLCSCGKRMKSAGKNKGYKCPKCGRKIKDDNKILLEINRTLKKGFYEVPPSARRHLSKPLIRCRIDR
ncbi:MAG: tRNA(Ile)(2)-agmatinylcytidine synthase [Methanobacterium sp.]|nr:tRNA(Ile)(2)-agmatinylcytidine synthase [Methanobacterium sp.]